MTRIVLTSMVTVVGLIATPALAEPAALSTPRADPTADLPMTEAFAGALGGYRDCVIRALGMGAVAAPQTMARAAMSRCTRAGNFVRAQLMADISTGNPGLAVRDVTAKADAGMAFVDPMIESVATDTAREQISQRIR